MRLLWLATLLAMSACVASLVLNIKENKGAISSKMSYQIAQVSAPPTVICDQAGSMFLMDYKETRALQWKLLSSDIYEDVVLRSVITDCTCTSVEPRKGTIRPKSYLEGRLNYTQSTLGNTDRNIIFETDLGNVSLKLRSRKIRDVYVKPNSLLIIDEHPTTLELYSLRARGVAKQCLKLSVQDFPTHLINVSAPTRRIDTETSGHGDDVVLYDRESLSVDLSLRANAPIVEHTGVVIVEVSDQETSQKVDEIMLPCRIENFRGVKLNPTAVVFGYVDILKTEFPIQKRIDIKLPASATCGEPRIERMRSGLAIESITTTENVISIAITATNEVDGLDGENCKLIVPIAFENVDATQIEVPILGTFIRG
jgi:hypothetical protein